MSSSDISPHIASIACVAPPCSVSQDQAADLLREHFAAGLTQRSLRLIRAIFSHSAIGKRHFAVDDPAVIMGESPDQRLARFTEQSVDLSAKAVLKAISGAGVTLDDVKGLVVNTCTGYLCPGISTYLMERLGLSRTTPVYDLVGGGAAAARFRTCR